MDEILTLHSYSATLMMNHSTRSRRLILWCLRLLCPTAGDPPKATECEDTKHRSDSRETFHHAGRRVPSSGKQNHYSFVGQIHIPIELTESERSHVPYNIQFFIHLVHALRDWWSILDHTNIIIQMWTNQYGCDRPLRSLLLLLTALQFIAGPLVDRWPIIRAHQCQFRRLAQTGTPQGGWFAARTASPTNSV